MGTRERAKTSWQLAAHNCERDLASLAGETTIFSGSAAAKLERLLAELEPLSCRYDVVVANPPYMGSSSLGKWMGAWVKKHYPEAYRDLCTGFIDRGFALSAADGYSAMVTMQSWMFLGSFEKLRGKILRNHSISSMAHLGTRAFGAIAGEVVSTTVTVFANVKSEVKGAYFRLVDMGSEAEKQAGLLEALANPDCGWFYRADASGFEAIPGSPIAYWLNERLYNAFQFSTNIEEGFRAVVKGVFTGNNDKFLRLWHEINRNKVNDIWRLYAKGGAYRKWYGNVEYVINWRNDAHDLKQYKGSGMGAAKYFGSYTLTWTKISSGSIAFRLNQGNVFFDDASPAFVIWNKTGCRELSVLAFLNSSLSSYCLAFLAPTLNYQCGDIKKLPFDSRCINETVAAISGDCIDESIKDWDAFESSVDFKRHPLV